MATLETQGAGGVVVNEYGEIIVVKNGPVFWGLPKGHVDGSENILEAAKREIKEETGIENLELLDELGSYERYRGTPGGGDDTSELKTIHMFLFKSSQELLQPEDPNNPEARWVSFDTGRDMLTHPKDREFLDSVKERVLKNAQK